MSWDEILEKYESEKWRIRAILLSNINRFSNIIDECIGLIKVDRNEYYRMVVDETISVLSETTGIFGNNADDEKLRKKPLNYLIEF